MPRTIPQIRGATDEELRELRHALGNRVNVYFLRAEVEEPNADRDHQCASYAALLAMVDAERLRRSRISDLDRLANRGRPFAQFSVRIPRPSDDEWQAELLQDRREDHGDMDGPVLIPGVDTAHAHSGWEVAG